MTDRRPSLLDLLMSGLDAARPTKPLFGKPYFTTVQFAMLGAHLYSSACLIGTCFRGSPAAVASMMWDPLRLDALWDLTSAQIAKRDELSREESSLRLYFLRSEFPALYSSAGLQAGLSDPKALERVGNSRITADSAAQMRFAAWVAEGLAFGLIAPERARLMAEQDYAPSDPESWANARAAGLDIPEQQDVMDVEEFAADLSEAVRALADDFYPEIVDALSGEAT